MGVTKKRKPVQKKTRVRTLMNDRVCPRRGKMPEHPPGGRTASYDNGKTCAYCGSELRPEVERGQQRFRV